MRTSDAFVARVSSIHVLQMSRTSSAEEARGTMGYFWSVLNVLPGKIFRKNGINHKIDNLIKGFWA
jgi:hypothetical protein